MPYCVVKSCKNNNIGKVNSGLSFHKFPRDPFLRDKWTQIIRKSKKKDNWTPSDYCVVCSAHFEHDELYSAKTGLHRLRKDAVPTKNIFSSSSTELETNITSVKIENDSSSDSEDDEPLLSVKQNSSKSTAEVITKTPTNRRLVIYYDATNETKKDSVPPKSPSSSKLTTQNISSVSIFEHDPDPLSIKDEIKNERHMDNISQTPPQSNISIISVQHEPDFKKKRDTERKKKGTNVKKKMVEVSTVEINSTVPANPKIYKLEKEVKRLQALRIKYKRKLKTLQQLTRRLNKRNASLKAKIKNVMGSTSSRKKESGQTEISIADDDDDDDVADDDDDDRDIDDDDELSLSS